MLVTDEGQGEIKQLADEIEDDGSGCSGEVCVCDGSGEGEGSTAVSDHQRALQGSMGVEFVWEEHCALSAEDVAVSRFKETCEGVGAVGLVWTELKPRTG